ncbi:uncharacterized protein LOC114916725 [Cajanus cajan]|uniref:uncharacterized protein LOC114916725 n=1 Tax=Cajanus cajan TaxID=3821 RepID=UPI0010FADF88|nr:uncharacterized protein LOC114916725 [Cajanus cajan]
MEIMMEGINNLTKVFASQSPLLTPMHTYSMNQFTHTQSKRDDRVSPVSIPMNGTEIIGKFSTPVDDSTTGKKYDNTEKVAGKQDKLKKRLFSFTIAGKDNGLLSNLEPLHNTHYEGLNKAVKIPQWIPMIFNILKNMIVDDIQSVVAAYIFGTNKDDDKNGREIIIRTDGPREIVGYRDNLKTLIPREWIKMFLSYLLPCSLRLKDQLLTILKIGWTTTPNVVRDFYQFEFMGKIDYLSKIFIPMNDMNMHWYLMLIDLNMQNLIMLDSCPNNKRNAH